MPAKKTNSGGSAIMTPVSVTTMAALALTIGLASPANAQTNPLAPVPIPAQVPAKEGIARIPDAGLWYWDTGGSGVPIVLLHPATGSGLIWSYQQPAFANAGYRVIAYSRRGYIKSDDIDEKNPGIGSEDLRHLADHLGLGRFHLVASAAGGSIASDFAFSYQDRLLSLTVSSNSLGVRDGEIAKAANFIRPKGWDAMPAEFRELGPSYRAVNPDGTKAWMELEHKALVRHGSADGYFRQKLKNDIRQARLKEIKLPVLLIAGVADTSTPPSISRLIAAELPNATLAVMTESGHSSYWEQPQLFNRAVLDHVGKYSK
jgi:pimeloyl-ACP methyl ester carboxylesterase